MKANILSQSSSTTKYFNNQERPKELTKSFTDRSFPPNYLSLSPDIFTKDEFNISLTNIVWKRASEYFDQLELFDGSFDLSSIKQGKVGNCYFISTISSICRQPKLIYRLFPSKYISPVGYYEVLLFIEGEWQIVIIDDYFPVDNRNNKLLFGQTSKNEIWFILIEKAWAKVNGSYKQTQTGNSFLAFTILTGFQTFSYSTTDENVFEKIKADFAKGYVANCSSHKTVKNEAEIGLFGSHTYSLVDAIEILGKDGKRRQFMQVRNPWGDSEWTGSFSNGSVEVLFNGSKVPLKTKQCGWFFIPFNEFKDFFTRVTVCEVNLDLNFTTFPSQTTLYPQVFHLRVKGTAEYRLESYLKFKTYSRDDLMSGSFILCAKVTRNKIGVNEVTSLIRSNDKTKLNLTTGATFYQQCPFLFYLLTRWTC